MNEIKPTYEELREKLDRAEKLITALKNNGLDSVDCNIAPCGESPFPGEREFIEAYIESEENFRNSMDGCPLGIRVITADGELFYANQAILDIFGYKTLEELKAVPREQLYTPESFAAHLDRKAKRVRGEYTPPEYRISIRRPDGGIRTLEVLRREIVWGGERQFMAMYQDVTERLQLESNLHYHADLIQNTPDAIISGDKEHNIYTWNKGAEQMYGWRAEEVIGKGMQEVVHPSHLQSTHPDLLARLIKNGFWTGEDIHQRRSGERFPVLMTVSLIKDKYNGEIGAVTVAKDITEQKKVEEALQNREVFLNSLIENTPSPLWVSDSSGTIIRMNHALRDLLNVTDEQVVGKYNVLKDSQVIDQGLLPLVKSVFTEGKTVSFIMRYRISQELPLLPGNDTVHILEITMSAIKNSQGQVTHAICQEKDVTDRIEAENALVESQRRFFGAFHYSPSMNAIMNQSTRRIVEVNDALCLVTGYARDEMIGKSTLELNAWDNPEQRNDIIRNLKENGFISNIEIKLKMKNGEIKLFNTNMSLLNIEGGPFIFISMIDITRRRKMEASLRFHASLVENVSDAIVSTDADYLIMSWNKAAEEMYGWSEAEVVGKKVMDITKSVLVNETQYEIKDILRRDNHWRGEGIHQRRNGEKFNVLISVALMRDENGKETGAVSIFKDITEYKKVEMAVHQSEERFRGIFQSGPLGIVLANPEYTFTMANPRFCEMFGYTQEELLHMTFRDVSFPENIAADFPNLEKLKKGQLSYYTTEKKYRRKNGSIFWGNVVVTIVRDNAGQPQGFLSMVQDITSRKADEERINHLNLALRSIRNINQLITREKNRDRLIKGVCDNLVVSRSFYSAWIILFDENHQPSIWASTNVNGGIEGLVETFRKGEMPACVKKAVTQKKVVVTKDPLEQCIGCPIQGITEGVGTMTVRLELDGTLYGILCGSMWRSVLIDKDEISLFLEVADDITFALRDIELGSTHELLLQEQLRAAKLESIGTLAGGIAHDFNNLLTGIMGNIGLAKSFLTPESDALEVLEEAEKAAVRSRDLTLQLLTFARGGKPIKKVTDITGIIKDAATFALRGSDVKLELSLPEDLWLVEADEGQISQVIHNLVLNADEAMPRGGTLYVSARNLDIRKAGLLPISGGNYVQIDVRDTGLGIPPEHLQRIFEPYFTTKQKGSGLGLTSAYSIIKSHGGSLLAESTLNQGSVFHIYLPASHKTAKGEKKVAAKQSAQAGGKVLVMDDDATIRKMLINMLSLAGYEAEATADGAAALKKYQEAMEAHNPFTAVIMDLTVPGGMGGKEAITKLLEIDPAARVVVSSGYATDPIMSEFKKYGFSAVIAKPYSIRQLQETLGGLTPKKKK